MGETARDATNRWREVATMRHSAEPRPRGASAGVARRPSCRYRSRLASPRDQCSAENRPVTAESGTTYVNVVGVREHCDAARGLVRLVEELIAVTKRDRACDVAVVIIENRGKRTDSAPNELSCSLARRLIGFARPGVRALFDGAPRRFRFEAAVRAARTQCAVRSRR